MDDTIKLLFQILIGFVLLNMVISFTLYLVFKQKEYLRLVIYWSTVSIVFVFQGAFQVYPIQIALAITVSVIPIFYVTGILLSSIDKKLSIKLYVGLIFSGMAATLFLYKLNVSFRVFAMPLSLAIASPFIEGIYWILFKRRESSTRIQKFLSGVMALGVFHCVNFALFRMEDGAQIWGWTVSFILYQMFSVLLPVLAVERMAKTEKKKLSNINDKLLGEINEHKRLEKSLLESEEKFSQVISTTKDAIMIFDSETKQFVEVNKACEELYGYNHEEFLSIKHNDLTNEPEDSEESIKKAITGKLNSIPLRYHRKKNGTVFPVEISVSVFELKGRNVVCGIIRDITKRKLAEEQLVTYQVQLKRLSSSLSLTEERERRHISEELHDGIGQAMTVIKMKLEELKAPHVDTDSKHILDEARDLLNIAIQDTRTLTFEISPPILYELGFEPAVEWLTEQFKARHNISIKYESNGGGIVLSDDLSFLLFKSVRELLFNVIKHARADRVKVSVRREKNSIRISIQDDGVGFDFSKVKFSVNDLSGFGLFSIRERMEHCGGNFDVESKPDQGTRITLSMPSKQEEGDRSAKALSV
jgi:PAS domain S-box-containing protein